MTKYATFDSDGFPTAFYSEDIHGDRERPVYGDAPEPSEDNPQPERPIVGYEPNPNCLIPADAIEITDEQWREFLANPGRRKWDDGEVVEYDPPPPATTADDVNRERQRRVIAGKVIDGVYVTGRDADARNLTNLALAAQMRIRQGDTTTLTTFRDGNNVDHDLTPPQVLSLWQQSAAYVSDLYTASWAIKAMEPLPDDVTDDALWP